MAERPKYPHLDAALPREAIDAARGASAVDLEQIRRAALEITERYKDDRAARVRELIKLKRAADDLKKAAGAPSVVRGYSRLASPDTRTRVEENIAEWSEPPSRLELMSGVERFGHALQAPVRAAFKAIDPAEDLSLSGVRRALGGADPRDDVESVEKRIMEAAKSERAKDLKAGAKPSVLDKPELGVVKPGGKYGYISNALTGMGAALSPIAGVGVLAGAALDPEGPNWKAAGETMLESAKGSRALAGSLALDPLNFVGVGGGKASVNAASKAMQAAKASGLSAQAAKMFADDVVKTVAKAGGNAKFGRIINRIAKTHGVSPESVTKFMGKSGEYADVRGLQIAGKEITIPGVGNNAIRKLGNKLAEPFREAAPSKFGVPGLDRHQRISNKIAETETRVGAQAATDRRIAEFAQKTAHLAPADKARRELLVREVLDPEAPFARLPKKQAAVLRSALPGAEKALWAQRVRALNLTHTEKRWLSEVSKFLKKQERVLQKSGVLEGGAANEISGQYYPRQYKSIVSKLTEWFGPDKFVGLGKTGQPLKRRTNFGGQPLGAPRKHLQTAVEDPHRVIPRYAASVSRAEAMKKFTAYLGDNYAEFAVRGKKAIPLKGQQHVPWGGELKRSYTKIRNSRGREVYIPKAIAESADAAFERSFRGTETWGLDKMLGAARKFVTVGTPGYMVPNVVGDSLFAMMAGPGPAGWGQRLLQARGILSGSATKGAGRYSPAEVRRLVEKLGYTRAPNIGATSNMSTVGQTMKGATDTMDRAAELAARAGRLPTATELAGDAAKAVKRHGKRAYEVAGSVGWMPAGERMAKGWESASKTALFMHFLDAGDSPALAAQNVAKALFDYGDRSQLGAVARNVVMFPDWIEKATKSLPGLVAARPAVAAAPAKFATNTGERDPKRLDRPPQHAAELGMNTQLDATRERALRATMDTIATGVAKARGEEPTRAPGGASYHLRVREPVSEALQIPANAAQLNFDPLVLAMRPELKAGYEWLSNRDVLTKRELGEPGLLPTGMGPESLQAPAGGWAPAFRYLPTYLASPQVWWAMNALRSEGDVYGAQREYAPGRDQRAALSLLNLLLRLPFTSSSPAEEVVQRARMRPVQQAMETEERLKGGIKKRAIDTLK